MEKTPAANHNVAASQPGIPAASIVAFESSIDHLQGAQDVLDTVESAADEAARVVVEVAREVKRLQGSVLEDVSVQSLPLYQQKALEYALSHRSPVYYEFSGISLGLRDPGAVPVTSMYEERCEELQPLAETIAAKREQEPDGILAIQFYTYDDFVRIWAYRLLELRDIDSEGNASISQVMSPEEREAIGGHIDWITVPHKPDKPEDPSSLDWALKPSQVTKKLVNSIFKSPSGNKTTVVGSDTISALLKALSEAPGDSPQNELLRRLADDHYSHREDTESLEKLKGAIAATLFEGKHT